ncbi:MAG: hypothetical protein HXY20_07825 [Acidobacteria bacterium]|nr:hypothetical protein [Acidobacteriota bacterium]
MLLLACAAGLAAQEKSGPGLPAVETGRLLNRPATDVYLAAASAEAHWAISSMAEALGDQSLAESAALHFERAVAGLDDKFWNPGTKILSFAATEGGGRSDELTVWPAVALMLRLIHPEHAAAHVLSEVPVTR